MLTGLLSNLPPVVAADIDLNGITEKHVMIPMRDGKKLSAYLYFPKGKGPWPVLMEQRYAGLTATGTRKSFASMAEEGYVIAAVNFRGTQLSQGKYVGYRALGWGEKQDGYDVVEWLGVQTWSTGKIGTFGSSQAGYAQNFLAVTQPPHLVCQYMIDTGLSLYHEGYRIGGTTRPQRFKSMERVCRNPEDAQALMRQWYQHPTYDDYWADENCALHFDKMNVPCFTVGSWYDFMCVGSVNSYIGRQHQGGVKSQGNQQLLIGPWLHGRFNKTNKYRDVNYPDNAHFDMLPHMISYFDLHLKGIQPKTKNPTVQYYVMGAFDEPNAPGNIWKEANDWPIPTTPQAYYLQNSKTLSSSVPANEKGASHLKADPFLPAEIPGRSFPGAQDARPFEKQDNVLTFTTDRLEEAVEWTGNVTTELYVSSSAKDTDFIVRVSDVYPDGRSILIIDMIRRTRFRDGFEQEKLLEPGKISKVAFNVGWLSQIFNKGHRIRVTIASTGAPFYEPNPNTGKPLTIETPDEKVIAENTIYHNNKHASKVVAPVVK
ncbi:MAG: CocE/NonD family hydrolase [Planctomycetaceae bacterium]|nr:CocE/NonD family hydrolase [Planctomycetaceae bacterium]